MPAFERTSKRRRGFPSETRVKRGLRTIKGGEIELLERLGRNDPCPCGSGKRFRKCCLQSGRFRRDDAARLLAVRGDALRLSNERPAAFVEECK
ncbi:MAG: SEC-C metal-binding domain-containing protein [Sphingorhabdus sp.]